MCLLLLGDFVPGSGVKFPGSILFICYCLREDFVPVGRCSESILYLSWPGGFYAGRQTVSLN